VSLCFVFCVYPKGATSFPDRGSYEYDQIRVSLSLLHLLCFVILVY